ncbi:MAG TPA: PIN domain-containing protein [Anaerolineae bacterium]|nr:PIN domain-containing protein [Anaerolineae bacterium]HQI83801.1 PIN domain-containing protein [Anaerolineae bacterium]
MLLVDANIVLRYILDDHPKLSARAVEILEQHEAFLPPEVVCEVVYVLQKVYSVPRDQIQAKLCILLDERLITVEKTEVLRQALAVYCAKNLDIVDALLWAYHHVEHRQVITFDEKLSKLLETE